MKLNYFVGVDISKGKLDIVLINAQLEVLQSSIIANGPQKISAFFKGLLKKSKIPYEQVLVCCENTGIYGRHLEKSCASLGISLWVEHALKIKRASTDMRGKSDKLDAKRIAEYCLRYQDKARIFKSPGKSFEKLRTLLGARETILEKYNALNNQLSEAKSHNPDQFDILKSCYQSLIKSLRKRKMEIEKQIREMVHEDPEIRKNMDLLRSIVGVGEQNAIQFIVETENFTRFQSADHLACYVGVVPFPNESGTVVKKYRVSKMANSRLKRLIHLAAMSAIRAKGELKTYYIRKVAEGKNKMAVINAVRNKLIHRMFAVIHRQTPYVSLAENISIK